MDQQPKIMNRPPSIADMSAHALEDARQIASRIRAALTNGSPLSLKSILQERDFLSHTIRLGEDPACVFRTAFDALLAIGQASLPVAAGLTMHVYITAALATVPTTDERFLRKRASLYEKFNGEKWLAGVCSVDQVRAVDGSIQSTVTATPILNGGYRVDGPKRFTSLLGYADVLFFTATLEGGSTGFFAVSTDSQGIEIGSCLGTGFLTDTDTRSLRFNGCEVAEDALLAGGSSDAPADKYSFSLAWFHALVSAPYIGAAIEALNICKRDEIQRAPTGVDLTAKRDLGKLSMQLEQVLLMSRALSDSLRTLTRAPDVAVPAFIRDAQLLKYYGTRTARDVASAVVERIGVRGLLEYPVLASISEGITFGPLHPRSAAWIESKFAAQLFDT